MPEDGVIPEKYIWFCVKCRIKGEFDLSKDNDFNMEEVKKQHRIASRKCSGILQIKTVADFKKTSTNKMVVFKNWND